MIALGSDHGGFALKEEIKKHLAERGIPFTDFGTDSEASCDYPVYAALVTKAVASGEAEKGILCCGTGIAMVLGCALLFGFFYPVLSGLTYTAGYGNTFLRWFGGMWPF